MTSLFVITNFGAGTMTYASWFKVPCVESEPGITECQGPPASTGGERLFTTNFNGTNTGGASDVDDLGHFQIDGVEITQDRWADSTDSWGISAPFDARLGTRDTAPHDRTWNGWIDESAIWLNRQLSVLESQVMYHAALGYLKNDPNDIIQSPPNNTTGS